MATRRPSGEGWVEVPFTGGGPKDGDSTFYRGAGYPDRLCKFLDPSLDPAKGVHDGDLLHVYEFRRDDAGHEEFAYIGTERARVTEGG